MLKTLTNGGKTEVTELIRMATLIMVAKYPQPNKCKTRLAAGIGADGAAAFARVALCDLLERFAGETALGKRVLLFAPLDQREVGCVGRTEPCRVLLDGK